MKNGGGGGALGVNRRCGKNDGERNETHSKVPE